MDKPEADFGKKGVVAIEETGIFCVPGLEGLQAREAWALVLWFCNKYLYFKFFGYVSCKALAGIFLFVCFVRSRRIV